jgi:hypothetical protein
MNKRLIAFLPMLSLFLSLPLIPVSAAAKAKAGGTCSKAGITSVVSGKTYTCIKSGKKLVWNKGVAVAASNPTPVATPTTAANYATLWEKYSWVKPTSSSSVVTAATDKFKAYVAVTRNKNTVIKIIAQDGADQTLVGWLKDAANLVLKAFDYPKLSKPFLVVVAVDREWVEKTYIENGWDKQWAKDLAVGMSAPGGAIGNKSNLYDSSLITRNNLLVTDKLGMMQMAGHEYFHAVQTSLAGEIADASGSKIPNWFLEGSAVFIGLQNASYFGWADYATEGREFALARSNAHPTNLSLLSEATKNNDTPEDADPYGIGAIATEFLVANIGMEKFMEVYKNLGKKQKFADAFKTATGVELNDFYTMFEEVRPVLGIPRS